MRRVKLSAWLVVLVVLAVMVGTADARIIYVDADAAGPVHDGSSWATAFNYVQEALNAASSGDGIRVAEGVYKPHESPPPPTPPGSPPVPPPPPRTATFLLRNDVAIRGGYAGYGQPDPDARDTVAYETILSGDLKGNDVDVNDPRDLRDDPCRADNSYHVVTGSGTNRSAILDGFTITGAKADGPWQDKHDRGGGMYNDSGRPSVYRCTFLGNYAQDSGAAIYTNSGYPRVYYCKFIANHAYRGGALANNESQAELFRCTFSGNSCDDNGAGMHNNYSDVTLNDCSFTDNFADYAGGGMYNTNSSPTMTNCSFSANFATEKGGGMNNRNSDASLTNCIFLNNSAGIKGGAMHNHHSSPLLRNCKFTGNFANDSGGAIYNLVGGMPMLINCTLAGNHATNDGGAIVLLDSFPRLVNCILWHNSDGTGSGESAQIHILPGQAQVLVNHTCVQGWTGTLGGTANIGDDPCFVDAGYRDANGVWFEGDYHLLGDSPCIDTGDNGGVPPSVLTDLDGMPRIKNGVVDRGAYEKAAVFFVDGDAVGADDGSSWADAFNRLEDALAVALRGDEIRVAQGSYVPSPPPPGQASNPYPADRSTNVSTMADLSWTAGPGATSHDVYLGTSSPGTFQGRQTGTTFDPGIMAPSTMYYWRIDEVGAWGKTAGAVWTFTTGEWPPPPPSGGPPANSAGSVPAASDFERLATFSLKEGVAVKGGYAGFGEADPDARDIEAYTTILSGDLNGDDVEVKDPCDLLTEPSRAENCYHVVTAREVLGEMGPNSILEGFTITGGNADGEYPDTEEHGYGGGMFNLLSFPTLIKCTFTENSARYGGGGMDNEGAWPILIKCTFSRNFSNWGGGLANGDSQPKLFDCVFIGNVSSYKGGGMAGYDSSPPVTNCVFSGNRAVIGGGMYNGDCGPKLKNCVFIGNSAEKGGAVYNSDSSGIMDNCRISGNSATAGGAIYNDESGARMVNCILSGNAAEVGSVMYNDEDADPRLTNCTVSGNSAESGGAIYNEDDAKPRFTNCILWGDTPEEITGVLDDVVVTYSNVQGGWPGEGNIDADPCFVELGDWSRTQGLVSHWRFDEDTGSTAYDSAGDNHGIIHGATRTAGSLNGALDFDGIDDYVDIPYDSSLDINASEGITLGVWIKLHSYPDSTHQGPIFGLFDSAGAGTKNYLGIGKSIYGNVIAWDQWPPSYGSLNSIKPDLHTWYHVAVVEDSSHRAIYINGCLDSSDNISESYEGNPPDTIRIGSRADAWAPFYFHGTIDEVVVFARALSDEEVWEVYHSTDYHLYPGTPCVDAGNNSALPSDRTDLDGDGDIDEPIPLDLDGNPRVADGDVDGNLVVDMGAYESAPYVACCFGVNHLKIEAKPLKPAKCKGIALLEVTSDQGVFVYEPQPGKEKLKASTIVDDGVNGPQKIHTSGSKPLEIGDVFGAYTVTNLVKIMDERPGKNGYDVDIEATFAPAVPVDLSVHDVTFIIDDGQGNVLDFFIPAGSFEPDGKGETQRFKYDSPKKSRPEIKAKFDLGKCRFELNVKTAKGTGNIKGTTLGVALCVGNNLGEEVLEVKAKKKHLEYKRKPKLDCCRK